MFLKMHNSDLKFTDYTTDLTDKLIHDFETNLAQEEEDPQLSAKELEICTHRVAKLLCFSGRISSPLTSLDVGLPIWLRPYIIEQPIRRRRLLQAKIFGTTSAYRGVSSQYSSRNLSPSIVQIISNLRDSPYMNEFRTRIHSSEFSSSEEMPEVQQTVRIKT